MFCLPDGGGAPLLCVSGASGDLARWGDVGDVGITFFPIPLDGLSFLVPTVVGDLGCVDIIVCATRGVPF